MTDNQQAAREWLPIESAPKDGTRVLLVFSFGGSERIECGRYDPQKFNSKPRPLWVGDALRQAREGVK